MNIRALLNTLGTRAHALPLVILYVTEGCNLRCMTCSYRNPLPDELTLEEIRDLAVALKEFGLRHIVYSGGEPLMRRDFPDIGGVFRNLGVRQTLLTNGLLLEKRWGEIRPFLDEIIVSLDGPNDRVHNAIRGGEGFHQILRGIRTIVDLPGRPLLCLRTVIQKQNFRSILEMVQCAESLGVDRISFLAADVLSDSFGRNRLGPVSPKESIMLTEEETLEFRNVVVRMVADCGDEFKSGFIAESPDGIERIVRYFEALLGKGPFPPTTCNAPMVSAVVTSTGDVQPCFFLPAFAHLRDGRLSELLNTPGIRATRGDVRHGIPDRCRSCVCTLHVKPSAVLLNRL